MYRSFFVSNFRNLQQLHIDGFERVNLIAGANNAGKTALLEALFVHCGAANAQLVMKIDELRGLSAVVDTRNWLVTPWDSIFHNLDNHKIIVLSESGTGAGPITLRIDVVHDLRALSLANEALGRALGSGPDASAKEASLSFADQIARVLRLEHQVGSNSETYYMVSDGRGFRTIPPPPPPWLPVSILPGKGGPDVEEVAELYGRLAVVREEDRLLEGLRILEPRLKKLAVIPTGGRAILHGEVGLQRMVPLSLMGEGMTRLAAMILYIANSRKGVALVDEIENGLHHEVLEPVWSMVARVARDYDTQVFATTHSSECIKAAHQAFSKAESYQFRLFRLDKLDGETRYVSFGQQGLDVAIGADMEVR